MPTLLTRPCKDEDGHDMTGMITIMNKAKFERDQGAKLAFLIRGVPSETWWPEQADHICFIKGRVGFKLPDWFIPANDKQKASSAGFAGAIAIFDKEWRGGHISYIHRDILRAQGKKLLDMIEAAAEKKPQPTSLAPLKRAQILPNEASKSLHLKSVRSLISKIKSQGTAPQQTTFGRLK